MEIEFLKLDFHWSGIFVNWCSMEIELYKLDFHWEIFFSCQLESSRLFRGKCEGKNFPLKIEFLKLDFHLSGTFVNWCCNLFTIMPPKWKSSFRNSIFTGGFFFFSRLFCSPASVKQNYFFPFPCNSKIHPEHITWSVVKK